MDRLPTPVFLGFPGGSAGKEFTCNAGDPGCIPGLGRSPGEVIDCPLQDCASLVAQHVKNVGDRFDPCVGKIPRRRQLLPPPVFWPGKFHGPYSPWGCKESVTTEWLSLSNVLEKEMAIHSSTIAWKIPWTEEPGRLQSMGFQRVGHDWATSFSFPFLSFKHYSANNNNKLLIQQGWISK